MKINEYNYYSCKLVNRTNFKVTLVAQIADFQLVSGFQIQKHFPLSCNHSPPNYIYQYKFQVMCCKLFT